MIVTGASFVGRYFKNCNLQVLNMCHNPISDEGISLIVEGLQCNRSLAILNLSKCGLSAKGKIGGFVKRFSNGKIQKGRVWGMARSMRWNNYFLQHS